jgi:hypothetical protein
LAALEHVSNFAQCSYNWFHVFRLALIRRCVAMMWCSRIYRACIRPPLLRVFRHLALAKCFRNYRTQSDTRIEPVLLSLHLYSVDEMICFDLALHFEQTR